MHIYAAQEQSKQESSYDSMMKSFNSNYTIEYKISSKWIFNDACRIVASLRGYYLNIKRNNAYVKINRLDWNESLVGNIWIKKLDSDYFQVVHIYDDESKEKIVGYIKEENGYIIFKKELFSDKNETIRI